jgi:RHS repeat-associated protein
MARCGFVVSLSSAVGSNRNSLPVFFRGAGYCLLPFVLLTATLGFAQFDVGGNGVQATEATNGEVSLDTLNIHLDIPIVNKAGVGLPFSYALHFNNNMWTWTSATKTWIANANTYGTAGVGWWYTAPYLIAGLLAPGSKIVCGNDNYAWPTVAGYTDANGNVHAFNPVIIASQNGEEGCGIAVTSATVVIPDGSGITVNLSYIGPNTVTFKDGTVATLLSPASIVDVNNNKVSVATGDGPITDTLGVTELTEAYGGTCKGGVIGNTFSYPTSSGIATVTVNCTLETIQTNFGCSGIAESTGTQALLPTSIDLPDGSSYSFTYESQVSGTVTGRLSSITYPSGEMVSYAYTGPNNGINCADGSAAGLTRTVSSGEVYTYTRNTGTWLTTTLVGPSPANNTNVYTFIKGSAGIFLSQSVENQGTSTALRTKLYCYNGNQTSCATATAPTLPFTQTDVYTTLAGMTTSSRVSTTFDAYSNVTKVAFYDFGASTPTRQTVAGPYGYTWNGSTTSPTCTTAIGSGVNNKPCQVQLENGSGTQLRNTYFQYGTTTNPGSLLSSAILTGGSTYLTTSATYNANGTVATSKDANGNQTSTIYGACNSGMPTKITLPNSLYSQIGWDTEGSIECGGAVSVSITDLAGNSISDVYNDPFWRITTATDQEGNNTTVSYGYNPLTVESILNFGTSTIDKFNQKNVNALTAYSQQREAPSSSNWDTVQSGYVWGSSGKTTSTSMPCATNKGSGCTNGVTTTTHDALGRPLVQTGGGGATLTYSYTGSSSCTSSSPACFIKTITLGPAPAGEVVKEAVQEYNSLGQLLASCVISSATGSTACGFGGYTGFPTAYVYNADGTVASVSKSSSTNTQTHSFTYDALGRTLTATYPENGTKQFFYDSAPSTPGVACSTLSLPTNASPLGNLLKTYDANGTTACYSYDTLNRVIGIAYSGANFDGANKYFVFDSATVDGAVMANTGGRLAEAYTAATIGGTKITDEGFSYTVRGEVSDVYEATPNSGGYYHTTATYFANGALNVLSGITGGPWTYTPDGKGRLYGAVSGSTNLVSSVTYNAANQPCIVTLGLGDTDTYSYDNNATCTSPLVTGAMTGYTFSVGATPTTDSGSLSWNANGTLRSLAITDGFNAGGTQTCNYGTSTTPGYDEQGQLVSAVCANSSGTNVWGQSFSYDAFNNLTKTVPSGDTGITWAPGYNQTNNQYTLAGTSYDSNGNLLTDTFHTYTWNQDNHPLTATGGATAVTYDAFGRMVEHLDGSTYKEPLLSPVGNIGLMSETAVSQFRIPLPGGPTYVTGSNFWHKDWLGSVRLVSGRATRTETVDRAFAPYGETYSAFGATSDVNFTGDNQDFVVGTFDTRTRELNPTQGRWISPDPTHAGWNPYAYGTNPLGEIDSSGLDSICVLCGHLSVFDAVGSGDDGDTYEIDGMQVSAAAFGGAILGQGGSGLEFAFDPGSGIGSATSGTLGELGNWQYQIPTYGADCTNTGCGSPYLIAAGGWSFVPASNSGFGLIAGAINPLDGFTVDEIGVIGKLSDTGVWASRGYNVFQMEGDFYDVQAANQAWIDSIIANEQPVIVTSDLTEANLLSEEGGLFEEGFSTFGSELGAFSEAGFELITVEEAGEVLLVLVLL